MGLEPERYHARPGLEGAQLRRLGGPHLAGNRSQGPQRLACSARRIGGALRRRTAKATPCSRIVCVRGSTASSEDAFVISHGGVARVLMTLIAGSCRRRRRSTRQSFKGGRSYSRTGAVGGSGNHRRGGRCHRRRRRASCLNHRDAYGGRVADRGWDRPRQAARSPSLRWRCSARHPRKAWPSHLVPGAGLPRDFFVCRACAWARRLAPS